jgi:hypothetical protein
MPAVDAAASAVLAADVAAVDADPEAQEHPAELPLLLRRQRTQDHGTANRVPRGVVVAGQADRAGRRARRAALEVQADR